jgi:hypothetical protein
MLMAATGVARLWAVFYLCQCKVRPAGLTIPDSLLPQCLRRLGLNVPLVAWGDGYGMPYRPEIRSSMGPLVVG